MPPKLLIVTGFGAFANVTDNPTQQIVREFETSFPSITITNEQTGVTETIEIAYYILEVSVGFCESYISTLAFES